MPGERDIRETSDKIEGWFGREAEVIPLFGRLSAGDQQRVFAPAEHRKIVVATNIAETSLTIPGIRFVIDSGLARISRYTARTRTRRLPVEPVSRSSADQRKGRAGRVEAGVCIRLYSEDDYLARPQFTQPEIQRSNLAEVILKLKAFRLGEIESFPFVNPPTPAAISGGYQLLQELAALDDRRELTALGRDLARLPIDPTLGRMLLQSQQEHATHELLIIAAGLSIQDPRERPLDQRDAADAAHRKYADSRSDFLTLLNLWNHVHEEWENLRTQGERRKFCRRHFLSYIRMREWQDLYAQLHGALKDIRSVRLNESSPDYNAIHRSVLSGLLGHVATREERNSYKAAGNRLVALFPGSMLFERGPVHRKGPPRQESRPTPPEPKSHQPAWIVAGEIVETSQLFVRTVAGIDPEWILQLAPHLCTVTHQHPHWSPEAGRVLVEEISRFQGLEIHRRKVAYGNLNPADATAIFIRSALVEEQLFPDPRKNRHDADREGLDAEAEIRDALRQPVADTPTDADERVAAQFPFVVHNRRVRQKIEQWQTRCRFDVGDLDEALAKFYARHLTAVASLDELRHAVRGLADPTCLHVPEAELIGDRDLSFDEAAFPEAIPLGGQPVALRYAYAPGEAHDGVTVQLPATLAESIPAAYLEWAVPGLREQRVEELLRALPKSLRRELMPFPPKIAEIVREFQPQGGSFRAELARFLTQRYAVVVTPDAWTEDEGPAHLRPRIELLAPDRKVLAAGRDLGVLRQQLPKQTAGPAGDPPEWLAAVRRWERLGLTGWTFGDLPERVTIIEDSRFPLYGWPGLELDSRHVNVRLFRSRDAAHRSSLPAVQFLVEAALQKELAWLARDLRQLVRLEGLHQPLGSTEELQESALEHLKRHLFPSVAFSALTQARFLGALETARAQIPGLVYQLVSHVELCLRLYTQVRTKPGALPDPTRKDPKARSAGLRLNDLSRLSLPLPAPSAAAAGATPGAAAAGPWLSQELASLMPRRFLDSIEFARLPHLSRYLKALLTRAERAANNPAKDLERARQLAPYAEALRVETSKPNRSPSSQQALDEYRWLLEEFKVSLFAQELGTSQPVSPKRLDQQLDRVRQLSA
jgi:ATP-dependent helicase HrpA